MGRGETRYTYPTPTITGTGPYDVAATTEGWGVGFGDDAACGIYLLDSKNLPYPQQFYIIYANLQEMDGNTEVWELDDPYTLTTTKKNIGTAHQVNTSFGIPNKGIFNVLYTAFEAATTVSPYPGTTVNIPAMTVKFSLEVPVGWNFATAGNWLSIDVVLMPTSGQAPLDSSGAGVYGVTPNKLDIHAAFLADCTVDRVKTPLKSITSSVVGQDVVVALEFPVFSSSQHLLYDPDFSLLISQSGGSSDDFVNTPGGIATVVIVPTVFVLAVLACLLVLLVLFLMRRRLRDRLLGRSRTGTSLALTTDSVVRSDEDEEKGSKFESTGEAD